MADELNDNKPNPTEAFQNLLKKNNDDALKLASQLFDENFQYREQIRTLKANQPKEGSRVLTADEDKKFQQFLALGLEADAIKEAVEKVPALESENQKLQKRDKLRSIERLGYDLDVLEERMASYPNAEFTVKKIKDAQDKSKELEVPFVTLDGKESSLDDFAKENFPKYLPVLKVVAEPQTIKQGNTYDPPPHVTTPADIISKEMQAQTATGRYSL